MHMASETLSVFAIVFYICLPINQKNKRQFNFLPLVKYLYFIFRITPTIDKESKKITHPEKPRCVIGALEETRTPDLLIRSQTLYPAELPAHMRLIINRK